MYLLGQGIGDLDSGLMIISMFGSEDVGFRCDPMSRKLITHVLGFSCVSLMECDPIELPLSPLERGLAL